MPAARQAFKTTDVLRLEVETTPAGLYNLLPNPEAEYGGWGWLTPTPNTTMQGPISSTGFDWLVWSLVGAGVPAYFTSDTFTLNANRYVGFRVNQGSPDGTVYARYRVEFLDALGAVISSSPQSAYESAGTADMAAGGRLVNYVSSVSPSGTVRARLRADLYSSTGGANPSGVGLWFRQPIVASGATAAAVTNLPISALPTATYSNLISPTTSIEIEREGLNLGTLTADILDVAIDPSQTTLVRPGKRVRLMVLADGTTWTPLFVGRITNGTVRYHPERKSPDPKRARVRITAVDGMGVLAQHPRPNGVATLDELPSVLEGAGVPWDISGNRSHRWQPPVYVATNERASAADQLALVRDSTLSYAWVSRAGVVTARTRAGMPGSLRSIDASTYTDIDLDLDMARVVNYVTVKVQTNAPDGEAVEVVYGPYVDPKSVDTWGARAQEFTVQGLVDATAAAAYAASVLASLANPVLRVNSLSLAVTTAADLTTAAATRLALLDLYDGLTVVNTNAGLNQLNRVTSIKTTIQADANGGKWLVDLGFDAPTAVAPPSPPPPLPDTTKSNTTNPRDMAPAANFTGTSKLWRDGRTVTISLSVTSTAAVANEVAMTVIPLGHRPPVDLYFACADSGSGALTLVHVTTTGEIRRVFAQASGIGTLGTITYQTNV